MSDSIEITPAEYTLENKPETWQEDTKKFEIYLNKVKEMSNNIQN